MAKKESKQGSPVIENRRARFDYEILDTLEVGMALRGTEIKSIRDGKISLAEGYVRVQPQPPGLFLHSVTIDAYGPGGLHQHIPGRARTLLAHRREIAKLARQVVQKGMTIVPLKLYFKNGYAKLLIGLGRGKTRGDKREAISKRDAKRDIDRAMSKRMP